MPMLIECFFYEWRPEYDAGVLGNAMITLRALSCYLRAKGLAAYSQAQPWPSLFPEACMNGGNALKVPSSPPPPLTYLRHTAYSSKWQ